MRLDILTVLPELLRSPFEASIMKRASDKGLLNIHIHNIRDFSNHKNKNVDDYQYGGGAGMVLSPEPISKCIDFLQKQRSYDEVIYMTPDGNKLSQSICNELSLKKNIIILCGHYKGIDERIRSLYVTREISIGDYVLSGGELAAAVLADSIGRLIPGVLNDESSALSDSFQDNLLSPPIYTRPPVFKGLEVPSVLLSGNQNQIDQWRHEQAIDRTRQRRPDILDDVD